MKNKRIFLKKCLLLACCCFVVLGCKDYDNNIGDVKLERCNTGTEFAKDCPLTEVLLFRDNDPENISNDPENVQMGQKYIYFDDTVAHLSTRDEKFIPQFFSIICNFPEEIKGWNIPSSGLPVLIQGRFYTHEEQSSSAVSFNYLELTYIKKL